MRIALTPCQNGPAPLKRGALKRRMPVDGGIDASGRSVGREIANFVPSRLSSNYSQRSMRSESIEVTESVETVQLQEAVRQRELAHANVKTLTAEVVRLAGELRAQKDSLISPKSTHRSSQSQTPTQDAQPPNDRPTSRQPAVTAQLLQQATRRRKRMNMWSVIQSWRASSAINRSLNRIGEGLGRRYQKRILQLNIRVWDRFVKQQERLEHALGCLMEKQTASAFDIWRLSMSDAKSAAQMLVLAHGRASPKKDNTVDNWMHTYGRPRTLFADPHTDTQTHTHRNPTTGVSRWKDPIHHLDSDPGREHNAKRNQLTTAPPKLAQPSSALPSRPNYPHDAPDVRGLIQRMDMKHYVEHIALAQMRARWNRRRLCVYFRTFADVCRIFSLHDRVRRRQFVTLSARHIGNLLARSIRGMWKMRLRGLRRQRAQEAEYLRVMHDAKIVVVAWRCCTSFPRNCLLVDTQLLPGTPGV